MTDQNSTCAGTQELPISQDIIDILGCGTDYYRVLNINKKSFTADELKKSYRKLALKFHPDKNNKPGAKEAFRLVSRAFTILSDPTKKVLYDVNGDDSYSPVSGSDNLVGPYFRRKPKAQQKKWPMMLKASPVIALIVYSIFLGVFTKN